MNIREQGFLLLTCFLGDPERKPLTIAQLRKLSAFASAMEKPAQQRELTEMDLIGLGCDRSLARKVLQLLEQEELLCYYLHDGAKAGCKPLTRISQGYPVRLHKALGSEAPGTLWYKGDLTLLDIPSVSVVGSRDLYPENQAFAEEIGRQAALQGYSLVSGNARGADRVAQEACLRSGGKVIAVVADKLADHPERENVLYLSEEGFDLPFTAQRALQRNRIIHSLSDKTFVVQCTLGKGGTWKGTGENLRHNWSQVLCFDDNSAACRELIAMGAAGVSAETVGNIAEISPQSPNFLF